MPRLKWAGAAGPLEPFAEGQTRPLLLFRHVRPPFGAIPTRLIKRPMKAAGGGEFSPKDFRPKEMPSWAARPSASPLREMASCVRRRQLERQHRPQRPHSTLEVSDFRKSRRPIFFANQGLLRQPRHFRVTVFPIADAECKFVEDVRKAAHSAVTAFNHREIWDAPRGMS